MLCFPIVFQTVLTNSEGLGQDVPQVIIWAPIKMIGVGWRFQNRIVV
jgi:hypothetical protein